MRLSELSIFLPAFNEEGNIEKVIKNATEAASKNAVKWELIIVDDGSTDSTYEIAKRISESDRHVKVIRHKINLGYGGSLKTGFYASKYKWISFMDSDGQFDFGEIEKFVEKQKRTGADLVVGYYKKRKASFAKILTSKVWELFVFLLFGLRLHDIDCGFKLVSKKVIDQISRLESERGAFISSELLIKAKNKGFRITEVSVTHYPRLTGAGTGRKLNVIAQSFIDLFKLYRDLKTYGENYKEGNQLD
jgi:glycosyltransferase involved in cell wall biosynthesis